MKRLEVIRAVWGVCQIFAPGLVAGRLLRLPVDDAALAVIRVLGARQLAQALATAGSDDVALHLAGGAVDMLHAGSMMSLAALDERRRRAAAIDSVLASTFAVAEIVLARRRSRR